MCTPLLGCVRVPAAPQLAVDIETEFALAPAWRSWNDFRWPVLRMDARTCERIEPTSPSSPCVRLLRALERFAFAAPPKRPPRDEAGVPLAAFGRKAVKRAGRRLIARGRAIGAVPEADDLHALRIRAKRLRYLLEALRPLTGRPGRRLAKQLARLQDVLGRFNDAVVPAAFILAYHDGAGAREDEHARQALTALADAELRRAGAAQADFRRAWRRFAAKPTLREYRALLDVLKASADD